MAPRGFATAEFAIDYLELTLPAANSGLREEEIPWISRTIFGGRVSRLERGGFCRTRQVVARLRRAGAGPQPPIAGNKRS